MSPSSIVPRDHGHLERIEDHVGAHVRGHAPADDHAGKGVDNEADVGDAGPGGHIREIGHP